MIVLPHEQGSAEWVQARLGIPTASQFGRIVTPKTMKLSASSDGYLHELLSERLLNSPVNPEANQWMERGSELESQAISYYELTTGADSERVGLCLHDGGRVGCSPDRLVGSEGGLEIKCPSAHVHVEHLLGGMSARYMPQVQGCMWITGRLWWDLMSFHPLMPPALVRVSRDEHHIEALSEAVAGFLDRLEESWVRLQRLVGDGAGEAWVREVGLSHAEPAPLLQ